MLAQEIPDEIGDDLAVFFQGKVPWIEQVQVDRLQVAFVRMRALRRRDRVVLSPDDQRWRLVLAKVGLPLRVKGRIGPVVIEQLQLDIFVAQPVQEVLVVELGSLSQNDLYK